MSQYLFCKFTVVWILLLSLLDVAIAQIVPDQGEEVPTEMDLRYADHREITSTVGEGMERYGKFLETVFEPEMDKQYRSLDSTTKIDIPQSLRMQTVQELRHLHGVAQTALDSSKSYARFKRDDAGCRLWVEVIQHYVDGLGTLTEEMGKSDISASAFASMTVNQVSTALLGISSLHPAVLPCFLEKGQYFQAVIPMIRDKADELRGVPLKSRPGFK